MHARSLCLRAILAGSVGPPLCAQTVVTPVSSAGSGHGSVERVVYHSDELKDNVFELFGVPVDGGAAPVRLNAPLASGGDVTGVFVQTAGDRVVYIADQDTNNVVELYSAPNDGSALPVKLNGPLVAGGNVQSFLVAHGRVVFVADATVDNQNELFSVPLDGSAPPTPLTPGMNVWAPGLGPVTGDGALVLFQTSGALAQSLYVVPTDASQPPLFLADSGHSSAFYYTDFPDVEIVPGDENVVYVTAEEDDAVRPENVYSARLDGSTPPVRLNYAYGSALISFLPESLGIAPSGERVLFAERSPSQGLTSIRVDGTGRVNLIPNGGLADGSLFRISADSQYAVFASHVSSATSLHLARLDGSQTVQLLSPVPERIMEVELAPNGTDLVYSTLDTASRSRLFRLTHPDQPVLLSGDPPVQQGVATSYILGTGRLEFTKDAKRVLFRGDLSTDDVFELYSVPLDGSQLPQSLNPFLIGGNDVQSFRLSADRKRALFSIGTSSSGGAQKLFAAPVDGSRPAVQLSVTPVAGGSVGNYAVEPPLACHPAHAP